LSVDSFDNWFIVDPNNADVSTSYITRASDLVRAANTNSALLADPVNIEDLRTNSLINRAIDLNVVRAPSGIYVYSENEDRVVRFPRNFTDTLHGHEELQISSFAIDPVDLAYNPTSNDFYFWGHSYTGGTKSGTAVYKAGVDVAGQIGQPSLTGGYTFPSSHFMHGKDGAMDIYELEIDDRVADFAYYIVGAASGSFHYSRLYYQDMGSLPLRAPELLSAVDYDGVQNPVGLIKVPGETAFYVLEGSPRKRLLKIQAFGRSLGNDGIEVLNVNIDTLNNPDGLTLNEDGTKLILTNTYQHSTTNLWTTDFYEIPVSSISDTPVQIGTSYQGPPNASGIRLGFGREIGLTTVKHAYPDLDESN